MAAAKSVFFDILLFLVCVVAGLFVSQFLAVVCLLPLHHFDLQQIVTRINAPLDYPEMKLQLLAVQGLTSFIAFVAVPLWFIKWKESAVSNFLFRNYSFNINLVLLTLVFMVVSLPFISVVVQWNEHIQLPSQFAGMEGWAKEKEEFLKKVTALLTRLDNPAELALGLLVIALLPALGEELVFRGYLQNKLHQLTRSPHAAIWISAFIFSAIHFQFYGFVPRMLLGGMFGYLYHYSGQFHLPVLAHFLNNGLMLVLLYLKNKGHIEFDIEDEASISLTAGLASLILSIGAMYLIARNVPVKSEIA